MNNIDLKTYKIISAIGVQILFFEPLKDVIHVSQYANWEIL